MTAALAEFHHDAARVAATLPEGCVSLMNRTAPLLLHRNSSTLFSDEYPYGAHIDLCAAIHSWYLSLCASSAISHHQWNFESTAKSLIATLYVVMSMFKYSYSSTTARESSSISPVWWCGYCSQRCSFS